MATCALKCCWKKILILSTLLIVSACGGGGPGDNNENPLQPEGTASPETTSLISAQTNILVNFNTSMDPDSLSLSGTLAELTDGGSWSRRNRDNDILTLAPRASWPDGDQTLTINISSTANQAIIPLELTYTVDGSIPVATTSPGENAVIRGDTPIVISFTESMLIASLVTSGSIWDQSDQGAWSTTTVENDTFTLSPATGWSEGASNLTLDVKDLAGNSIEILTRNYTVDTTLPVASVTPGDAATLNQSTAIVFTFTETMNIDSLNASGTLWDESDNGSWSVDNDVFTLQPASSWSLGAKTFSLDINDIAGNPLATLTLNYSVGCPEGQTNCSGSCIDTSSDINNCGACSNTCAAINNGTRTCEAGNCVIASCSANFADCNSLYSDGCEVNTTNDINNCSSCGNSCNDSVSCTSDSCASGSCANTPSNRACGSSTTCRTYTCNALTGCSSNDAPSGTNCGTVYSTWSECVGSGDCPLSGTQSRTRTPRTCNGSGNCVSGTSATETRSCSINSDGRLCPGGVCLRGRCDNR